MISQASSQEAPLVLNSPAHASYGNGVTKSPEMFEAMQYSVSDNNLFDVHGSTLNGIRASETGAMPSNGLFEPRALQHDMMMDDYWMGDHDMAMLNADAQVLDSFDLIQ